MMPSETTMPPIICIGDALIDLLQQATASGTTPSAIQLIPHVGGAPANVAAGIAKLGGDASFAGAIGDDQFGTLILSTLSSLGVDTQLIKQTELAPTTLALVTLAPESGERSFAFYHRETAYQTYSAEDFSQRYQKQAFPIGGLHLVSNSLTSPQLIATVDAATQYCQQQSGLISFDINYRPGFWLSETTALSAIKQQLSAADMVKFSDEELDWMRGSTSESDYIAELFSNHPQLQLIMVTLGADGVKIVSREHTVIVPGFPSKAVDTTGAGDAFMAGLRFWLQREQLMRDNWTDFLANSKALTAAANFSCACGALTVAQFGAIPALPTLDAVDSLLNSPAA